MKVRSIVNLAACASTPLASYLKALGVFRIIGTQADASARGCWHQGRFNLDSQLDGDQLVAFFLKRYEPSPLIAPWNGASGFYEGDDTAGLEAIAGSSVPRLATYSGAIRAVKQWPQLAPRNQSLKDMCAKLGADLKEMTGKAARSLSDLISELEIGRASCR